MNEATKGRMWIDTYLILIQCWDQPSQQEIPQDDTQIWDQGAQNCGGSLGFGQGK